MTSAHRRTFVGFGFGAIQGGLFLYEASRSGNFHRLVAAEVLPEVVESLRQAGGHFAVNIAHADRIEIATIGPVEIENPQSEADRHRLIQAVAEAEEIATAVPSIQHYTTGGAGSIHRILAEGLRLKFAMVGPPAVIYAAENHNQAAEILQEAVLSEIPGIDRSQVGSRIQFLNTVIGKMSGAVFDPDEIRSRELAAVTAGSGRAFLVEAFNRILVSRVRLGGIAADPPFRRGITIFEEKDDLIPFEEAKLYGHNATHALAAYMGMMRGVRRIADLRSFPDILAFLHAAFLHESGASLVRKHCKVDRLFTEDGYRAYAEDLLERMLNPYLLDSVERVGRDPERKLGWDDRLIGTMRLALEQGIQPRRFAFGAAAALAVLDSRWPEESASVNALLEQIWRPSSPKKEEKGAILGLLEEGRSLLRRWRRYGYQNLEGLFT